LQSYCTIAGTKSKFSLAVQVPQRTLQVPEANERETKPARLERCRAKLLSQMLLI